MDIHFAQPLTPEQRQAVLESRKVSTWLNRLRDQFDVHSVTFDRVYFFGSGVGYAMANIDMTLNGERVAKLALVRGDSVAVKLDLLAPDGRRFTAVVEQARVPVGAGSMCEIPAGMIDDGQFTSKAVAELSEEIGCDITITADDLVPLAHFHPSPGGCDEAIMIYHAEKRVPWEAIQALEGRQTGVAAEHETLTVHAIPNDDLPIAACRDGKSLIAYYAHMAQLGLVARPTPEAERAPARTSASFGP